MTMQFVSFVEMMELRIAFGFVCQFTMDFAFEERPVNM